MNATVTGAHRSAAAMKVPEPPPPGARFDVETSKKRARLRGPFALVLGAAAIAALAAFAGKLQGELLLTVAFVVVVIGDLVGAVAAFDEPEVEIDFSGDGVVDVPMGAIVHVRGSRHPLWMRIGWWDARWFTVLPAPDGSGSGWIPLRPRGRGRLRWIDVDAVARGPLGIWEYGRRHRIWLPVATGVGPAPLEHELRFPILPARPFGETVLTRGADELVRGVRDYQPGDSRKLVHWPATAHHGRLLVRETEVLGTIRVRVVVHTPFPGPATEVTLGRAAWLVLDCLRKGWEVELVTVERAADPVAPALGRSPFVVSPTSSLLQDVALGYGHFGPPVWVPNAYALLPREPLHLRTVVHDVRSPAELTRRLAAVAAGPLEVAPTRVPTRVIAPEGDSWQ